MSQKDDHSQKTGFMSKIKGTAHNLKEKILHKDSSNADEQLGATQSSSGITDTSSTSTIGLGGGPPQTSSYSNTTPVTDPLKSSTPTPTLSATQDTSAQEWKPLGGITQPAATLGSSTNAFSDLSGSTKAPSARSIVENQPSLAYSEALPVSTEQKGEKEVLGRDFDLPTINQDEVSGKDEKTFADISAPTGSTFSGAGLANPVDVHGSVSPVDVGIATEGSSELVGVTPPSEPALEPKFKDLSIDEPVVEQDIVVEEDTVIEADDSTTATGTEIETNKPASSTYIGAAQEKLGGAYQGAVDYTNQTYSTAADTTSSAYNTTADTASQAYNVAADKANQAYNVAADKGTQAYNVAADTGAQAYNVAADTGAQAYNVAAEKASQAYNVAAEKAGQGYDIAADKASQGYNMAAEKASQGYQGAKDYAADTYEAAKPKVAEAAEVTKQTAQDAATGTVKGAAGVIQGVQEYAGVTEHAEGETPVDAAGKEVVNDETAQAAKSTTVSVLTTAGAVLAAGAAMAGQVISTGAQYAKEAIIKSPDTAGYSSNEPSGAPVIPSDSAEEELVRRRDAITSGNVPKDEAFSAGGAGIGEVITHEGGSAFNIGNPATFGTGKPISESYGVQGEGGHHDISTAVPTSQEVSDELASRMDAIATHNVPKDEAAVAAGAGAGEILSHGDKL